MKRYLFSATFLMLLITNPVGLYSQTSVEKSKFGIRSFGVSIYSMSYFPNFNDVNKQLDILDLENMSVSNSVAIEARFGIPKNFYFGLMTTVPIYSRRHSEIALSDGTIANGYLDYAVKHSMFTMERKFSVARLDIFPGLNVGETKHEMTISQTEGISAWDITKVKEINNFSQTNVLRTYVLHPQINAHYHIFQETHIRVGLGYVTELSTNAKWKAVYGGKTYNLKDSPKTSSNGMTLSLGFGVNF